MLHLYFTLATCCLIVYFLFQFISNLCGVRYLILHVPCMHNTHTLTHTYAHTWVSENCLRTAGATLLSSPTDECGLCHGMTATLPINQLRLLLQATVGRVRLSYTIKCSAPLGTFPLVSAQLDTVRLGMATVEAGFFFVFLLLPCATFFVVDLEMQQQLCNKRWQQLNYFSVDF